VRVGQPVDTQVDLRVVGNRLKTFIAMTELFIGQIKRNASNCALKTPTEKASMGVAELRE